MQQETVELTVDDGFSLFAKSTELTLKEYTEITRSQADIELFLMQHLGTFSTVIYGSFSRKTIVSPLKGNIIDMLVVYREADIRFTWPSRIFSGLRDCLVDKYPDAYVEEGKLALVVPVNGFRFKIHPAYPVSTNTYMMPSEKFDDWARYDISAYNAILGSENVRHKGMLIDIIRMVKTWNRVSGHLFNGYYLELLVTSILEEYEIESYTESFRIFFRKALSEVVFQKYDPANIEFKVQGLHDVDDLVTSMLLLKKSWLLANRAIQDEEAGNAAAALRSWGQLFPGAFPTSVDMAVGKIRKAGIKGAEALRMMMNHA